ncbi:MAG: GNAT family N-acetyltransferase [Oricola sp.]
MKTVPVIETERLILREHRESDLDAFAAIWNHPDVYRFTRAQPSTREEIWQALVRHRGMWAMFGFGYFVVQEKASGLLIGEVGVQERKRALDPSLEGTLEAGWALGAEMQGKGYARESMRAVLGWCAEAHPEKHVTCIIDPDNARSIRLAEDLGFRELARTAYNGNKTIVFRRG